MTENNQTQEKQGGIAILPKTETRPMAIVGMDGITEEIKTISEQLTQMGLEHVVMSIEEVEKEGITREDLLNPQLKQKLDSSMLKAPIKKKGGSKMQQTFVRKKKGKKTHRKKK
jgi:hypothetical protein